MTEVIEWWILCFSALGAVTLHVSAILGMLERRRMRRMTRELERAIQACEEGRVISLDLRRDEDRGE